MFEEALQIAEKRRKAKGKGDNTHLNAEFQSIARRDKKAFLSDQCKRHQRNISCKDGINKGQKWYGPNRSRRFLEEVERIHRTVKKRSSRPR